MVTVKDPPPGGYFRDDWEGALRDAVLELGRAAIDARMCGKRGFLDDGSLSEAAWNRENHQYYIGEIGSAAQFYRCTRPDRAGGSGGVITVHPGAGSHFVNDDTTYVTYDLEQVRVRIGDITSRWKDIPSTADLGLLLEQMDDLFGRFGVWDSFSDQNTPVDSQGNATLAVNPLSLWNLLIDDNGDRVFVETEGWRGSAALAFKTFAQCFITAVNNCGAIVQVFRGAAEAEKALWEGVKKDVVQTLVAMTGVCDQLAGESSSVHVTLDGVLTGAALVSGFISLIPSPVQPIAGGISITLSIVQVANTQRPGESLSPVEYVVPTPPPIPNYRTALDVLDVLLNSTVNSDSCINLNVTEAEELIDKALRGAWSALTADRRLFDPTPAAIEDVTPQTLARDPQRAASIVEVMNTISGQLSSIASLIEDCAAWPRGTGPHDSRIGIGADGPWTTWRSAMSELGFLVRELAAEASAGAENVRAADAALGQAEADSLALLESISALNAAEGLSERLEGESYFWRDTNLVPSATVGVSYSLGPSLGDVNRPRDYPAWREMTFSVSAGNLPPGLRLEADGSISGTPALPGDYTFTVVASAPDGNPLRSQEFQRSIQVVLPVPAGG